MTRSIHAAAIIAVVTLFFCLSMLAQAAVPSSLNYQGYLTDPNGSPVDGIVQVVFSIYVVDTGGVALWTDTATVAVESGLFSVALGAGGSFPPGLFDTALWLGVAVAGDPEMMPRRALTTVGFAFKADDALSLQGQGPAAFDQAGHVVDLGNPHGVTAGQSGAATPIDIANLQSQLDAALVAINQLQIDLVDTRLDLGDTQAGLTNETTARIAADDAEIAARVAADMGHDLAIADIQDNTVLALDGVLLRPDAQTALFTDINVQVVNGTGESFITNGVGNVIVGYNEVDSFDPAICSLGAYIDRTSCEADSGVWASSHKSGSHNVVVGAYHNYSRFGGLVVGQDNSITGLVSSVSGGFRNTASGSYSSVNGGESNIASDIGSSISGGDNNRASGSWASVSGGSFGTASGDSASVSGGLANTASFDYASVSGGDWNTASGSRSSISGGYLNTASGELSSVSGGSFNSADGSSSSVSGGGSNTASGEHSTVSGGTRNDATGGYSSISGGYENTASGSVASISGGLTNTASSLYTSVSGGANNVASGQWSSVSGGGGNTASGDLASVSGGTYNTASGRAASVNGGGGLNTTDGNEAYAEYSSILGGRDNFTGDGVTRTVGDGATVSGGQGNTASGNRSSVSGGLDNAATFNQSSVSGGNGNTASGNRSSVSGGLNRSATSDNDWHAGSLFQDF